MVELTVEQVDACLGLWGMEGSVTGVRSFQLVPTEESPLLLLTQVRSLLQKPVGNPTLADA